MASARTRGDGVTNGSAFSRLFTTAQIPQIGAGSARLEPSSAVRNWAADSGRRATLETKICGQRLSARRTKNEPDSRRTDDGDRSLARQAAEMSRYPGDYEIMSGRADFLVVDAVLRNRSLLGRFPW